MLGALAVAFLSRRGYERLGFRSLGDWSRERLGLGERTVREWARVWRALEQAPLLRESVLAGEVSWTVARRIAVLVTPENDASCLETVRGRSIRAVEVLVAAAKGEPPRDGSEDPRVRVQVACSREVAALWPAALELARRVAGEALPTWQCAEAIAAESVSAAGIVADPGAEIQPRPRSNPNAPTEAPTEPGLRVDAWPRVRWPAYQASGAPLRARPRSGPQAGPRAGPVRVAVRLSAADLDRRLRRAVAGFQRVDLEIGRVLRQVVDRRLHRELGFDTFERYVVERLDLSARTARRWVRIARAEYREPQVANAFRAGRITGLQVEVLLRGGRLERALRVTLRRLEDDVPETEVAFSAPPEVAALFRGLVAQVGLRAMLEHAIVTWLREGARFRDYADFERDGWRCTVPACRARRNLQSHHIRFRSAGGPDVPENRTTLCAFHHLRGVHAGLVSIRGRAPDALIYRLGVGTFRSGDWWISRTSREESMASNQGR